MNYTAYGLVLSSALPLPELPRTPRRASLHVRTGAAPIERRPWAWLQARPRRRRGTWVAIATDCGDYRIVFDSGAEFVFSPSTASIVVRTSASRSAVALRHRLIDQVVPMVMSHLGRLVLHASALSLGGAAVAFVGAAGAGKSTLASSFARDGAATLADDALVLDRSEAGWMAVPAYPGIRLVSERGQKRRHTAADGISFAARKKLLRRVYALQRGDGGSRRVRIEAMSPRDSIMTLVEYAFVLDTADRERMAAHFSRAASAAAELDVRRLVYPRKMSALPLVRRAVLEDLEALGRS